MATSDGACWPEVSVAKQENRREIVLHGADISSRIETNGLDESLFKLTNLNFLEISRTSLSELSSSLGQLVNITNLVLRNNKLEEIPKTISKLNKLKYVDVSSNKLTSIPEEMTELSLLHTFVLADNEITNVSLEWNKMTNLHILNLANNVIEQFPEGLSSEDLIHLSELHLQNNSLTNISPDLCNLPSLKLLDVTNNRIIAIPPELSLCSKLKQFGYEGNSLKDKRLAKMANQCSTKAVLDHLSKNMQKDGIGAGKGKKARKKKASECSVEEITDAINILRFNEDINFHVIVTQEACTERPYIVCCIVKDLNFNLSANMFKRFIAMQSKLHDDICAKRTVATIATHDLAKVKAPLKYDARPPAQVEIQPLGSSKSVSAGRLYQHLLKEAAEFRKQKKRNTNSGIHRYLDLLEGKERFPCLVDESGKVISLPPLTNCEETRIETSTSSLFLEVTSSISLDSCKKVMDALLGNLLSLGCGEGSNPHSEPPTSQLIIEQVRVMDAKGGLKVVYPSRTDLSNLQGCNIKFAKDLPASVN